MQEQTNKEIIERLREERRAVIKEEKRIAEEKRQKQLAAEQAEKNRQEKLEDEQKKLYTRGYEAGKKIHYYNMRIIVNYHINGNTFKDEREEKAFLTVLKEHGFGPGTQLPKINIWVEGVNAYWETIRDDVEFDKP